MIDGKTLIGLAFAYVGALFFVAWAGDRIAARGPSSSGQPVIYALSIAVFCTSWTFFGSVGLASSKGYDFFPVYVGAIIFFLFGHRLIRRVVRIAKRHNITSVADFLAARYGKSQAVAAVVAIISLISSLPYIALQLKAVALSVNAALSVYGTDRAALPVDTALVVAVAMAVFTVLFGTRHADATEHQHGLMLAIATESIVKLAAFLTVGAFITLTFMGNPTGGLATAAARAFAEASADPKIAALFGNGLSGSAWLTVSLLSFIAILLLPRQFHVVVVENQSQTEIDRARWLFPLYLVLINLFVVPIAIAGLMRLPRGAFSPDTFVLALPLSAGSEWMTLAAFVGGLSAATAMVIVESVAVAIMVCNGLVAPLLLRRAFAAGEQAPNMTGRLLAIRRVAILGIIGLSYEVYCHAGLEYGLASFGLISFAGIAQLAPAFFIGLFWRKGTARGAIAGMTAGFCVWAYTLGLPWFAEAGLVNAKLMTDGPWGLAFLSPRALFFLHFDPLTHGVLWSLAANTVAYVMASLIRLPTPVERLQANLFVADDAARPIAAPSFKIWRTSITAADLQATVGRYLGPERAERSFVEFARKSGVPFRHDAEADVQLIRFTEHLLASAIGAASARLVLSLLLERGNLAPTSAMKLLDDASEALQYNRDLLQSALDQVRHGLAVFDKNMQLVCWNRQFRELLQIPPELGRIGVPLGEILRYFAERGDFGPGRIDQLVSDRLVQVALNQETLVERVQQGHRALEIRTAPMPQGGIVTTYSDITERKAAADALAAANESLERRVADRTAELSDANLALADAKAQAETANADKTRFLAAASHDILQPLNAARLYASSLVERRDGAQSGDAAIASRIDQSLNAVEDILGTLIEIARLDTGTMQAELADMPVQEVLDRLRVDFEPQARERGLKLHIIPSSLWVRSDRRLLPRLMQNLVSNAVKYTSSGGVVVGARRTRTGVTLQVWDTGPGIAPEQQSSIFKEFRRLPSTAQSVSGLGLGLSIVERISKVLDHRVALTSEINRGSCFAVSLPRVGAGNSSAANEAATPASLGSLSHLTVLCIDNEVAILEGMRTLLATWKCTVVSATSTRAALAVLAERPQLPDVIVADFHLDSEVGLQAVAAISLAAERRIPAVIITADASADVQRRIREAGHTYLRKPVKVAALRAALSQISVHRADAAE